MIRSERWERLWSVFHAALEHEGDERAGCVAEACADDIDLRAEVEELLRVHETATGLMEGPPPAGDADGHARAADDGGRLVGQRLGRYVVRRVIDRGGTSVVYEAEQDRPRKSVALKVLHLALSSRDAMRQLDFEARILARLKHPAIAEVYEVGTFDLGLGIPQPFIAMELVDGVPLTDAAARDGLDLEARIRLLAGIADAVQFAHRRGVIHLDLKPANILVVADPPAVKIIDFGVARLVDRDLARSMTLSLPVRIAGTLPYMSPEQISGDPDAVDTLSDVYALGVIAWELLAGRPPYDIRSASLFEAVRIVRETEPPPLRLDHRWSRDLGTVVRTAMAREPSRRYGSAGALAADLRLVLGDEAPVVHPPGLVRQLRRLIRRHRALAAGIAATFAALAIGLGIATTQAVRARRAEADAREVAAEIRRLAGQILFEVSPAVARMPGATALRRQMIGDMLAYLEMLEGRGGDADRDLLAAIADAHEGLGNALGSLDLENTISAHDHFLRAIAIRTQLLDGDPGNTALRHGLARACFRAGRTVRTGSREESAAQAARLLARALSIYEAIDGEAAAPEIGRDHGTTLVFQGMGLDDPALIERGVRRLRSVVPIADDDPSRAALANGLRGWAVNAKHAGAPPGSFIDALHEARQIEEALVEAHPNDVVYRKDLQRTLGEVALIRTALGESDAGIEAGTRAVAIAEGLIAADGHDAQAFRMLEVACSRMVQLHEIIARAADEAGSPRDERLAAWEATLHWARRNEAQHLARKDRGWVTEDEVHYAAANRAVVEECESMLRALQASP